MKVIQNMHIPDIMTDNQIKVNQQFTIGNLDITIVQIIMREPNIIASIKARCSKTSSLFYGGINIIDGNIKHNYILQLLIDNCDDGVAVVSKLTDNIKSAMYNVVGDL